MSKNISTEAKEILKGCKVEGLLIKLPPTQLDRNLYLEVKKSLELIGGKWKGGKVAGFVFNQDPTELLEQVAGGEKRNLKKEFQFFGTPDSLADSLAELAKIKLGHSVLEPSAGQGAIVKAIHRINPNIVVNCCELMEINQTFLFKIVNCTFICPDFLKLKDVWNQKFDRIVANPPFHKNQDILHIREMYNWLKPNGRLVSVSSMHWSSSKNKKEVEFKEWLQGTDYTIEDIDRGVFKESGTMVGGYIIVINKK